MGKHGKKNALMGEKPKSYNDLMKNKAKKKKIAQKEKMKNLEHIYHKQDPKLLANNIKQMEFSNKTGKLDKTQREKLVAMRTVMKKINKQKKEEEDTLHFSAHDLQTMTKEKTQPFTNQFYQPMDPMQESFFGGRFPNRYPKQHPPPPPSVPPPPENDIQKRRVLKNLTGYGFEPASSLRPTGLPNSALLEKIDITKNKALLEADKPELPKKAISKPALLYCGTKEESLQEKDRLLGKVQQAKDQYTFEKNKELLDQQIGEELPQPQKRSNPIDPLLNPEEDYMRKKSITITSKDSSSKPPVNAQVASLLGNYDQSDDEEEESDNQDNYEEERPTKQKEEEKEQIENIPEAKPKMFIPTSLLRKRKQQEIKSSTKMLDPPASSTTHSSLRNATSKNNGLFDIPMPDSSFLISSSELKLEEEKKFKLQDFYKEIN